MPLGRCRKDPEGCSDVESAALKASIGVSISRTPIRPNPAKSQPHHCDLQQTHTTSGGKQLLTGLRKEVSGVATVAYRGALMLTSVVRVCNAPPLICPSRPIISLRLFCQATADQGECWECSNTVAASVLCPCLVLLTCSSQCVSVVRW